MVKKEFTRRALLVQDLLKHPGFEFLLGELQTIEKSAMTYLEESMKMEEIFKARGILEVTRSLPKRLQSISHEMDSTE